MADKLFTVPTASIAQSSESPTQINRTSWIRPTYLVGLGLKEHLHNTCCAQQNEATATPSNSHISMDNLQPWRCHTAW